MWSKSQVAAFQKARALAHKWAAALERLGELAKLTPQFADRIRELQTRAENAQAQAELALQIDPTGQG